MYWELHVLYNLPPPNCWSCLLLRGYRRSATVFKLWEKLSSPSLLSIPSVTINWRQNTVLWWCWWPVIAISDWSPSQVRHWTNKICSHQSFAALGCRQVVSVAGFLRESSHFANFIYAALYLPKQLHPTNAKCLLFTVRGLPNKQLSSCNLAVFARPTLHHYRLTLIVYSVCNLWTAIYRLVIQLLGSRSDRSSLDNLTAIIRLYSEHDSTISSLSVLYISWQGRVIYWLCLGLQPPSRKQSPAQPRLSTFCNYYSFGEPFIIYFT